MTVARIGSGFYFEYAIFVTTGLIAIMESCDFHDIGEVCLLGSLVRQCNVYA